MGWGRFPRITSVADMPIDCDPVRKMQKRNGERERGEGLKTVDSGSYAWGKATLEL